jgi:hypothetical protein
MGLRLFSHPFDKLKTHSSARTCHYNCNTVDISLHQLIINYRYTITRIFITILIEIVYGFTNFTHTGLP